MPSGVFVTTVNCMDGRTQDPVSAWMKRQFGADYVDTITEPGPDGILAGGPAEAIASIRRRVEISACAHGSKVLVIVSHDDCAGNPVSREQHLEHLAKAVDLAASWSLQMRIVGVYVNAPQWKVEVISDTGG